MIKKYLEKELSYEPSKLIFKDGAFVQISGKVEVVKSNANILLKLTDDISKNSINQLVFPSNKLHKFFEEYIGQKIPCVADIKFVTNTVGDKKYQAIEIHNIHCEVLSEEEKKEVAEKKEEETQTAVAQVREAMRSINDKTLKKLCMEVYRNTETQTKVMSNPATEHSAYNEKQGIIKMTADTVNLANTIASAFNNNFSEGSPKVNIDLIKAGAILCNVGRAYMLEFDEGGNIVKTESNFIDNDTLITRDLVNAELRSMAAIVDESGKPVYDTSSDVIKELMHMIISSKSKLEYNPTITPRTKHAMILADVVSMVFTKGLFENLEKTNEGEKFVKAYDGGRSYVLY